MLYSGCARKHATDCASAAKSPGMTSVLMLQQSKDEHDPNLDAYREVFNSVSLYPKSLSPKDLEAVRDIRPGVVLVVRSTTARTLDPAQIRHIVRIVESGAVLITEEITPLSQSFGFSAGQPVQVHNAEEIAYPDLAIKWANPADVAPLISPEDALPLDRERNSKKVLAALAPRGRGKCLLLAAPLDPAHGLGYERFPYLLKELSNAGIIFPFRSERLAALFDPAYRSKAELPHLAQIWRSAGIASLHVGAWDFFDLKSERNEYLAELIEVCHQNGILVYAWLEWPHVSHLFWTLHPQWRETTAAGREAKVDWRSLMNLENPDCFKAATEQLGSLLKKFDWDGVDIAELYFESPAGPLKPEDFTPMNKEVRTDFRKRFGFDPREYFLPNSRHYWKNSRAEWLKFVDYRVELERSLNQRVLQFLADFRRSTKPSLALILLYVDNICDPSMREAVGADLSVILPLLEQYNVTLVMEDPWTVWHLGPRRYEKLALSYAGLTRKTDRLGIDINIVNRAQEVFPTQKQTGSELLQLLHYSGKYFPTVMVYSEQTIYPQDLELMSNALASDVSAEETGRGMRITNKYSAIFRTETNKQILVDGREWPCAAENGVLLPKGTHEVSFCEIGHKEKSRLIRLNGTLLDARYTVEQGIGFSYQSNARAIAAFSRPVRTLQIDDTNSDNIGKEWIVLPAGLHNVRAVF
jgi:hypothetical protein